MRSHAEQRAEAFEIIRRRIVQGEYKPFDRIPSQLDLAIEFNMTEHVIRPTIGRLREVGYIITTPQGSYVRPRESWPESKEKGGR